MSQEKRCDYNTCKEIATTKGHVWTRDKEFVEVNACDEHSKLSGFFPEPKEEDK